MIWTRAPADIKRCNAAKTEAADLVRAYEPGPNTPVGANAPAKGDALKGADLDTPVGPSVTRPPEAKSAAADPSRPNEASAPPTPDAPKVAPEQEFNDYRGKAKVGARMSKLRDLNFGDGNGVREVGGGNCRLKVPHFSLIFKCEE